MRMRLTILVILVAGVATLGFGGLASRNAAPPRNDLRAREQALAHLVTMPIPPRNLYQLTNQLKLRPPRPIPHVIRRVSPNYPVGHRDRFYVLADTSDRYF